MKKCISIIIFALLPIVGISAKDKDNSDKVYIPEKGDIAFGVSLNPILDYAGKLFSDNGVTEPLQIGGDPVSVGTFNGLAPTVSIMAKYMLTDNWGLRANVGLLLNKDKSRVYVQDDEAVALDPSDDSKLIDSRAQTRNGMSMMLGAEYRKGKKRVQGVFGMGAIVGFVKDRTSYNYSNTITSTNPYPSSGWTNQSYGGYRILKEKTDGNVFFGLTGSIGVECFVAPKVSLGAEMNLNLYYVVGGKQYVESESYNASTKEVDTKCNLVSPGDRSFSFGTENLGGSLYMAFYF